MINNRQYSVSEAGRLDGRIDFRHLAPYLGLGWGKAPKAEKRWGVAVDVGAMLQGRPRVALAPEWLAPAYRGRQSRPAPAPVSCPWG